MSDKLEQFCDRRIRRSFLPVTSSRKWQSFEERLRFRNQFPQWTHPAFSPRLPHWGKKRIRLRPVPGQSAKSDRKAACFPVTLSQPISTIDYFAFVYRGMACHAAGCRFHPYSVKHSFRDYFWAEISSLSHNHQFNWWFTLGPDKGRLLLPPKGGMLQACYWSTTKWYYSLLSSIRHSALQCTFLSQIL